MTTSGRTVSPKFDESNIDGVETFFGEKGSAKSGNWGHAGRPGRRGGSAPKKKGPGVGGRSWGEMSAVERYRQQVLKNKKPEEASEPKEVFVHREDPSLSPHMRNALRPISGEVSHGGRTMQLDIEHAGPLAGSGSGRTPWSEIDVYGTVGNSTRLIESGMTSPSKFKGTLINRVEEWGKDPAKAADLLAKYDAAG